MKSFTLLLILMSLISCRQQKDENAEGAWTKINGDCTPEGAGISSQNGCTFRMNKPTGNLNEVTYNINFAFTAATNSSVEFFYANSSDLSRGTVLRMQRDENTVRFYIRDHEKTNQEILASDLIDNSGMIYKIKHTKNPAKITLTDNNGTLIFNTNNDLTGTNTFNNFITGGQYYGFKIRNAIIKSASF